MEPNTIARSGWLRYPVLTVLLVAGVAGFALGWMALSTPSGGEVPGKRPDRATPVIHRFPLLPADVRLDRETAAVAVDSRGRVLVAWASQTAESEHTLWLARSSDRGITFEKPAPFRQVPVRRYKAMMRGKEITRVTSVAPRLAAHGEAIHLAWTEAVGEEARSVFSVARTADGGQTFSEPVRAHGQEAGRPAFTSFTAGADGVLVCSWLDNRRKGQHPFCSIGHPDGERFDPEQLVFAKPAGGGVCPCCDTAVARTAEGITFTAFRNNDEENRDIYVARAGAGATESFEAPVPVTENHWRFEGCPHDGPSLAVSGERLHVAWMDAHTGKRRIYHASSGFSPLRFTARELAPGSAGEQGHPQLAAAGGVLHAVWDASLGEEPETESSKGHHHPHRQGGSGRAIFYARSDDTGSTFASARPVATAVGAFQVNPSLAVDPTGNALVVWSEITENGKSVVVRSVPSK